MWPDDEETDHRQYATYFLLKYKKKAPLNTCFFQFTLRQLVVNCWFGSRWFGIRIGVPLSNKCNNPFHKGNPRSQESKPSAPNHQLTWVLVSQDACQRHLQRLVREAPVMTVAIVAKQGLPDGWISYPLPWEPTFPSFLGIISPIFLGLKTFIFPLVLGSKGRIHVRYIFGDIGIHVWYICHFLPTLTPKSTKCRKISRWHGFYVYLINHSGTSA